MDVLMPQLGETVTEGKVAAWFKQVGDRVAPGDTLFEVETDKVSMEVPATSAGFLTEIRIEAGMEAAVGAVVAVLSESPGAQSSAPAAELTSVAKTAARPTRPDPFREVRTPERNYGPAKLPGGIAITPRARRLAVEAGIDGEQLTGLGRARITSRDIEASIRARGGQATPPPLAPDDEQSVAALKALYRDRPCNEIRLDAMRQTIARRLVAAKQTVPHFYLAMDVGLGAVLKLREDINAAAPRDAGGTPAYKVSLNDFIVKAFALALQAVPMANAAWAGDRILQFEHSDIGIAVAVERGLLTPVLRDVEVKSILAVAAETSQLIERARARKLHPQEYQGGASVVTNLGAYGVREFSAIINPPHATILAVGAARRQPVETEDGGFKFESQLSVTLSCDHRVVDGAVGAELLAAFTEILEAPMRTLF